MPWLPLQAVAKLSVEFDEADSNIFFLYPGPVQLPPVADTNVAGRVILELPAMKKVKTVALQLVSDDASVILHLTDESTRSAFSASASVKRTWSWRLCDEELHLR